MTIEERIKLARNGDESSYKYIMDNYSLLFCDNVVGYTKNIDDFKRAYELAPKVIDEFLNSDNSNIYSFIRNNAVALINNRKLIKDAIKTNSKEDTDFVINYYKDSIFGVVKVYNDVLSDKKLMKFSKKRIEEIIKNSNNNISTFNVKLHREKTFLEDEEFFFKRYILLMGMDDDITNYFVNKYDKKEMVNNKEQDFKTIVTAALSNLKDVSESIKRLIKKEIDKKNKKDKAKLKEEFNTNVVLARNGNIKVRLSIKENDSDLKDIIFKEFKTADNEEELEKIINLKYAEYFDAYMKGNSTVNLRTYLNTRIRDYLRRNKVNHISLGDNYNENLHIIEYLYKKVTDNDVNSIVRTELRKLYTGLYYDFYTSKKSPKKYFEEFLFERERYFKEELNDIYNKHYVDDELIIDKNCTKELTLNNKQNLKIT